MNKIKVSTNCSLKDVAPKIFNRVRRNTRIQKAKPVKNEKMRRGDILKPFQWQPGQSGNPKGMPKGTVHFNTALKRLGEETGCFAAEMRTIKKHFPNFPANATVEQMLAAMVQIIAMKKGYPWAYDRCFGKVSQTIDFNQKGEAVSNVKIDITALTPQQVDTLREIVRVSTKPIDGATT